jgi:hypothetical protein
VSLDSIKNNWEVLGSALTTLSLGWAGLRKVGGPRNLLLAIRSQWRLNMVILDKDAQIAEAKAGEARARKEAAEAREREAQANERTAQANARTEAVATMAQTILAAAGTIQDARERGLLVTLPPSSNADTPPPAISSTLPPKPEGPLTVIHPSD